MVWWTGARQWHSVSACQAQHGPDCGACAQALPSFLTTLPLTHLDVSACRNTDLSVVADMTRLATLSLQARSWDPVTCSERCILVAQQTHGILRCWLSPCFLVPRSPP